MGELGRRRSVVVQREWGGRSLPWSRWIPGRVSLREGAGLGGSRPLRCIVCVLPCGHLLCATVAFRTVFPFAHFDPIAAHPPCCGVRVELVHGLGGAHRDLPPGLLRRSLRPRRLHRTDVSTALPHPRLLRALCALCAADGGQHRLPRGAAALLPRHVLRVVVAAIPPTTGLAPLAPCRASATLHRAAVPQDLQV